MTTSKRRKHRLAAALIATAAALGLTVTSTTPAQAITMWSTMYCAWPGRATFDLVGDASYNTYRWTAYSPSGWVLGSYSGRTWYTPWEDVTVRVASPNDPWFDIVRWCR